MSDKVPNDRGECIEGDGTLPDHHPHPESASEASQTSCPPPRSLVEMPAPWLSMLLPALGQSHETFLNCNAEEAHRRGLLRPLFRTCPAFRDLVLSERRLILDFVLPIASTGDQNAAQEKLVLGCRRSTKVHLILTTRAEQAMEDTESSATSLLFGAMAAVGKVLEAIISVKLDRLEINAVVPSWLGLTCPNMTSLDLEHCRIRLTAAVIPAPCHQLTTLQIGFPRDEPGEQSTARPCWQHHLRALTGLTSLEIFTDQHTPWFVECCSVVGAHLTKVSWVQRMPPAELVQLPAWHPCLVELHLNNTTVADQGMEALLSMRRLQVLHCAGFTLQHSYTHRPCTWQHLGFNTLSILDFDRLPLGGVQSLEGGGDNTTSIIPSPDLGAAGRVAAALAKCGGITTENLGLCNCPDQDPIPALQAAMAVAAQCRATLFVITGITPVTPALLEAFKQHLPAIRVTDQIQFHECTFTPEVWPLLLPSLPPTPREVVFLSWGNDTDVTEAQATLMCEHAWYPVEVTVCNRWSREGRWKAGWEERVQAAMAAAGHQHVKLTLVSGCD